MHSHVFEAFLLNNLITHSHNTFRSFLAKKNVTSRPVRTMDRKLSRGKADHTKFSLQVSSAFNRHHSVTFRIALLGANSDRKARNVREARNLFHSAFCCISSNLSPRQHSSATRNSMKVK